MDEGGREPLEQRALVHAQCGKSRRAHPAHGTRRTVLILDFDLSMQDRKPDPSFPVMQYHPSRKGGTVEILDHNLAVSRPDPARAGENVSG